MITVPTNGDVTPIFGYDALVTMSTDLTSDVLDFEHARVGSMQFIWTGQDANDGTMQIWVSNEKGDATFGPLPNSLHTMAAGEQSHMWLLTSEMLGYRYAKLKFFKIL